MVRQQLLKADVAALESTLGSRINGIWSAALMMQGAWGEAPSFSIRFGSDFLVAEAHWRETPHEFLDYHVLGVRISDTPLDVAYSRDTEHRVRVRGPVSGVGLPDSYGSIEGVDVLSKEERAGKETVTFDSGLVFHLGGDIRLAVVCVSSILDHLEATVHGRAIDRLYETLEVRLSLR